ncbi:MAG: zinc ABC transporter substrate-binding protein [Bacillota bacterium]|nr:zinc ABC transporter substrate-binding protein [Bacillota bacterium]
MSNYMKHGLVAKVLAMVLVISLVFGMAACGTKDQGNTTSSAAQGGDVKKISVVATTTFLADMAKVLVGDQVEVIPLMGVGIDPHQYKASAGDIEKLQNASIVLYHGLHLEGKMGDIFEGLTKQGKTIIVVEKAYENTDLLADEDNPEIFDPHVWFDVQLWKKAVKYVADQFSQVEGIDKAKVAEKLAAYEKELDELHKYVADRANEVESSKRVLITAHDAFRYFGRAYGFEVKGLQGISTDAEAGINDVTNLADFIVERKIKAIFVETSVPTKNIQSLQDAVKSKGEEVGLGGELYSDSLGDEASGHATYILTIKANIDTIVDALIKGNQ